MKGWIRAARSVGTGLALSVLSSGAAFAQYDDEPLPTWYVGPFVGYTFADPDRGADDGLNLQLVGGRVLYDAIAVEVNLFATQLGSELAGGPDTDLMGGGVDLALGAAAAGTPVFLLGAGMVQQDIGGQGKTHTFGNLGLGLYLPFSLAGELWRVEGRYHVVLGEHPALPDEDVFDDVRINLGAFFTFGGEEPPPPAESVPPPPEESVPPPPAAPVEADTDTDGDGIPDASDQCPGTPPGTPIDPSGCEPQPEPPPAEEPKAVAPEAPAPAPAAEPVAPPSAAAAPPAPAPVATDILQRAVYFGSESSSLTAKGYETLRDVAAALQADPQLRLEIQGHADTSGAAAQNVPLARERADVVREFLISLGIAGERLVAKGYGAYQPVNDNGTIEHRATNRRVTFRRLEAAP